jgi:translocation and assembly module TamB
MTRWRIDVTPFTLDDAAGQLTGEAFLRASQPLGLRGKVAGHWRLPDEQTYRFSAAVRGDLDQLGTDISLVEPARLAFAGTLLNLTGEARVVGAIRAVDWDGSPWVPQGALPKLSGSVAVVASARSTGIDGTLTSPAVQGGQVRVQGAGAWHEGQLEIGSLRIWLPRQQSELTTGGTITFGDGSPRLDLRGEWTSLRWPLAGDATVQSAKGRYTLSGAMPYSFTTQASVVGPAIPETRFDAAGSFDKTQLLLERVDGKTLDGTVRASGRLAWSGEQSWQFGIEGRSLDISKIRPGVTGRINVTGSIEGRGFASTSPWTARLGTVSGTLFGRALTGRGEVAYRDGTFELRQVRVGNGASRIDVNGRWGETGDLRWDADLRSLAIVAPGLAGELVSSGSAKGTAVRPEVTGEVHLRHLRYGGIEVASADATVDVDASDRRTSSVDLRAASLAAAGLRLDSLHLRADGLTREHDLRIDFAAPHNPERRITEFSGVIAANGSFDAPARAWRGNLNEVTFTFPDDAAKLLQPAALEFGPELVRAAPVCIATGESRLCVEGERVARPASWRFLYSAQDWPLRRLLRTLLGWREFDGRLQASGWAELRPGSPWVGGTTLLVDHPTLDIPRNQFRSERIDLGSARVDVYVEPEGLRANLDLDVAEGTRIKGEVVGDRRADLLASPLQGTLQGESAALTALPLLVPEMDRAGGSLDARITVGGTLGDPTFDGAFQVRDGRFELYRTNLVLSKVTADGKFEGDELTFEAHGETAKGPVAIDGRFRWPDGVMTGEMHIKGDRLLVADTPEYRILASPDLRLRSGAGGYEVEGDILVPSAKISPKDLSTSVSTSPDEKIVGVEVEDTGPSTLQRVHSRVRIVLGDDVRVESYGLKARLGGELTVVTQPGDEARAIGAINVVEGQYKALGQDVKITKGKFAYANTPLNSPQLELTGERYIKEDDVTITVNVRGTLAKPFVSISSTPAMPNNEALSYLLTGRSIDTLQSGEATSVNKTAENLALSGGGFLLGGLGKRVGLDEVTLERTSTDDTAVTLGKYLSPNLFVSYGVSIAEAINTIKLRYTLNERWSLKAEAGLDQSADVEYKIER